MANTPNVGFTLPRVLAIMDQAEKMANYPRHRSPLRMKRWKIGHGDRAIRKTILHMQVLVLGPEGVGNPAVRVAAIEAARGATKNVNEIDYVLAWVKRTVEFRGEEAETLQSPVVTLQLRAGDCDDHSILIAAMLRSLGYKVQFKTVAASAAAPGQFSHVYVIVQDKQTGQWKGLDSTVAESYAGWEPPMVYRAKNWRHKGLGDDGSSDPSTAQVVDDLAYPITSAIAARIAPPAPPMLQGGGGMMGSAGGATGIPTWVWLLGAGAVVYFLSQR